ncbi:bacteriocin immunity protein [Lactococcus lactis]|uniref:bacteriocin immunity protein n=1 Tax=Lactococcus lactis TaxID=1358 RepID=UPI003D2C6FDF
MDLINTQRELLNLIYNVILNQNTSQKERILFKNAKNRIESGKNFDSEMSELLKELMYLPNSEPVNNFTEEARKRMYVGPGTGGTTHGFSNYQTK